MALISGVRALRSYLKLICEYELQSLPKKVSGAKDHGETTSRSDHLWSAIFCVIVYLHLILYHTFSRSPSQHGNPI